MLQVEVAYGRTPEAQLLMTVALPEGATVADALKASGLLARCPEIDLQQQKVGIHSRLVNLTEAVRNGDRVELYRPLLADPKEGRRLRAAARSAR